MGAIRISWATALGCGAGLALLVGDVLAQGIDDPIPEEIKPGVRVEIENFLRVPSDDFEARFAPIQYLYHAGDGSGRLFVADLRGQVWLIEDGRLAPEPFLDAAAVLGGDVSCEPCSVRAFAFDPEYDIAGSPGFGKFYTLTIRNPESSANHPATPVFRWTDSAPATVDVVSEWRVDTDNVNSIFDTARRNRGDFGG